MDVVGFCQARREFSQVDPDLVNQFLLEAARQIGVDAWGPFGATSRPSTRADDGQMYLAAHLLSQDPMGQGARLDPKGGKTTYLERYEELRDSLGIFGAVAGGGALGGFWR